MSAEIVPINRDELALWDDFVTKNLRAQATGDFEDGRAARIAWRRFLDFQLPAGQREFLDGGKVVRL